MTSFRTDGFLSSEISEFEEAIESNLSTKLNLAADTNRKAHELIYSIKVHSQHLPDLLIATLLTRQSSSFQAFLILLRKGLLAQAEIMLRNIAETMFVVGAIGKDKTFAKRYVLSEEISRKKALIRLKRHTERRGQEVDQQTLDLISDLEDKIRNEEIRKFTTEQIAQIAGLSDYYDTLYPLTSMAVHTSTRGLDKSLQTNDQGEVYAIDYGPVIEDLDMHLDYGISMMLYTLHEIAVNFEVEVESIEKLQKQNKEIAGVT